MSLLSRLFGGGGGSGSGSSQPSETYEGFTIFAEPMKDGGSWRLAARIEKEVDGETKSHQLIRADTFQSADEAAGAAVAKAKQIIDEQGARLLG